MKQIILVFLISINFVACGGAEHSPADQPQNDQEQGNQIDPTEPNSPLDPMDPVEEEDLLSFEEDMLPIFQNRCTLCHKENSGLPFWEDYDVAFEKRDRIRQRVFVLQNMPQGNATGMTLEERELVALWVDQGALF